MNKCPLCSEKRIIEKHHVDRYTYSFCFNCQVLFLNPQPSQKNINKYYKKKFNYSDGLFDQIEIRKRAVKILKNLKRIIPEGKSLLDIGSGYGFLVDEANKLKINACGIEPSKKLCLYSRDILSLNVANFSLDSLTSQKKYDFITMVHIIEHVRSPAKFIKKAVMLLKDRGILYIETPNLNSHLYKVEAEKYTFLIPPDHLWIFSKNALKRIINKAQELTIIKTSTYSRPEHFMGITKRIFGLNASKKKVSSSIEVRKNLTNSNKITAGLKYKLLDKLLAPILTPLLNLFNNGSILELYIKKK